MVNKMHKERLKKGVFAEKEAKSMHKIGKSY